MPPAARRAEPRSVACVAFLRGVNVGGKHLLPMASVRAAFEEAGARDVSTYLQSGNVRFGAPASEGAALAADAAARLAARHGFEVPVVVRTVAALARALEANPFRARDPEEAALHVAFLAATPSRAQVAALDADRSPPDAFAVVGADVYLHLPNGVARTKLTTAWLDRSLSTVSTLRNARTVRALAAGGA